MHKIKSLAGQAGLTLCAALCGTLTGCVTNWGPPEAYAPPPTPPPAYVEPAPAYAPPPAPVDAPSGYDEVVIRSPEDFYQPLNAYGHWLVVGSHGRCWMPEGVRTDWRPYCNGNWVRTDAGWYWQSDEPWAWATYHYGRWEYDNERYGWYWIPDTQWAPAWVSWHQGGGYLGWAPLASAARVSSDGSVRVDAEHIDPHAYVFVEPRHFLEPVRPTTVIVDNTTIIHQTVILTNVKIVNNIVINEGPHTQIIEQASGSSVRPVSVQQLRRKQEAEVMTHPKTPPTGQNQMGNLKSRAYEQHTDAAVPQPRQVDVQAANRAAQTEAQAQARAQETEKQARQASDQQARNAAVKAQAESARAAALNVRPETQNQQHLKESLPTGHDNKGHKSNQTNVLDKVEQRTGQNDQPPK